MNSAERIEAIKHFQYKDRCAEKPLRLMEICGTHTMSIARSGIKQLLPPNVRLISGPGCPVCVTPAESIDRLLTIAAQPGVILCSYGDLIRVPGTRGSLKDMNARRRSSGEHFGKPAHKMPSHTMLRDGINEINDAKDANDANESAAEIKLVYSAMDAVETAAKNPERQIVFAGVGFETTAPGTAAAILEAEELGLDNFYVYSMLKYTFPALRLLLNDEECRIDGLICPGHVAAITGSDAFRFITEEYGLPAVTSGFEEDEVIEAVYELCRMSAEGSPDCINLYRSVVKDAGNAAARAFSEKVFEPADSLWRGLGNIPGSGMKIREAYAAFDAEQRFGVKPDYAPSEHGCCCGSILRGRIEPAECPLFGKACTPADPVGPCMVSGEGACAAAFKYGV